MIGLIAVLAFVVIIAVLAAAIAAAFARPRPVPVLAYAASWTVPLTLPLSDDTIELWAPRLVGGGARWPSSPGEWQ